MGDSEGGITRRSVLKRSGTAALGAAAVWSAPSIRTTSLAAGAGGTPPPKPPKVGSTVVEPTRTTAAFDPASDPGAGSGGILPVTGGDPRTLLIAGGATLAAGSAIVSIVKDPAPARGES